MWLSKKILRFFRALRQGGERDMNRDTVEVRAEQTFGMTMSVRAEQSSQRSVALPTAVVRTPAPDASPPATPSTGYREVRVGYSP